MERAIAKSLTITIFVYVLAIVFILFACQYGAEQAINGPYYFIEKTPELTQVMINTVWGIFGFYFCFCGVLCFDLFKTLAKKLSNY